MYYVEYILKEKEKENEVKRKQRLQKPIVLNLAAVE